MKQKGVKVMAILGLIGILISVIGTGLLFMFQGDHSTQTVQPTQLTKEQLDEIIKNQDIKIEATDKDGNKVDLGTEVTTGESTESAEKKETVETTESTTETQTTAE